MKQALMVLDIQNDYLSDQARMTVAKHQIELTINGINDLIKRAWEEGVYFSKKKADAFSNPSLITYLSNELCEHNSKSGRSYAKARLIECCVTATMEGALARKFAITVVEDAVAGATD
ncbi:hypothetical protein ACQKOF_06760 [Lysinibacillus sp. NPDC093190]|uniref:hypothetical protein n=1 Tax=Lysinibacillus sp. NPDC093190 TaxID=3390575 RepID=UPI003D063B29